ncbi:helix-turn-helix domain-containing protein [Neobacillus drentensis]|uniref:helix-turn-helix domain-containing protein n=1 Tax=Neobacillus drentensis TaxID=220684 RepID=UPI002FFEF2F6
MAFRFFQKAKEIDVERNFTSEMNDVEKFITQDGHYKRLVRFSDEPINLSTLEQAEILKNEAAVDGEAELDLSHLQPTFTGPEGVATLERKEAEILRYLIEREPIVVSKEELLTVWADDDALALNTIKSYISKIKRKLRSCYTEENSQTIQTIRGQGYRWVSTLPTKIIKVL